MSKERFEYEKQQLEYIKEWFDKQEDAPFMEITYEYFVKLIEWATERLTLINRVQELEQEWLLIMKKLDNRELTIKTYHDEIDRLYEQNKRYREELERCRKVSKFYDDYGV